MAMIDIHMSPDAPEADRFACEDAWPRWTLWSYDWTGFHMYGRMDEDSGLVIMSPRSAQVAWALLADDVYSVDTARTWVWAPGAPLTHEWYRRARS